MSTAHKCVRLTKLQHLKICDKTHDSPTMICQELAEWARHEFKITSAPSKSTIAKILKNVSTLQSLSADCLNSKKARSRHQLKLDESVVEFVKLCELEQISLIGEIIMGHARQLAELLRIPRGARPQFSRPWLQHLQSHYNIRWKRAYGEAGSVDLKAVNPRIQELRHVIHDYRPRDVYNMDESAFFYDNIPRGSLCFGTAPSLKQSKARVTMAVCANADGTHKQPVLFLGKSSRPRWLSDKPEDLQYMPTERAWMTSAVFCEWLHDFDQAMGSERRHILLLVDNASSHAIADLELENIRLEYLPPNITAKIQPMDQGIIAAVKRRILQRKMKFALRRICTGVQQPYKVGLLRAMKWCEAEWEK